MKKLLVLVFSASSLAGCTETPETHAGASNGRTNVTYEADTTTLIANPERGWYFSFDPPCCDVPPDDIKPPHAPLSVQKLQGMRDWEEKVTLYRDIVKIEQGAVVDKTGFKLYE